MNKEFMTPEGMKIFMKNIQPLKLDNSSTLWKQPAVPRHVIQMLIVDDRGRFLLMHRSNNVRSARNVWSIPTGTHELGETIINCLARELKEEFHLEAKRVAILDQYENIAGDTDPPPELIEEVRSKTDLTDEDAIKALACEYMEQYHWVLTVYLVEVKDVTKAVNKEPDRHDQMIFPHLALLGAEDFLTTYKFHSSLHDRLFRIREDYLRAAKAFLYLDDDEPVAVADISNMQPAPPLREELEQLEAHKLNP